MSSKLPCPCGACQGKLVSSYVRHQHMKKFVVGGACSVTCNTSADRTKTVTEDVTETPEFDLEVSVN